MPPTGIVTELSASFELDASLKMKPSVSLSFAMMLASAGALAATFAAAGAVDLGASGEPHARAGIPTAAVTAHANHGK